MRFSISTSGRVADPDELAGRPPRAARLERRRQIAHEHFLELDREQIRRHGRYIVDAAGYLYEPFHAVVLDDHNTLVDNRPAAYYVTPDGDLRFLVRAAVRTLTELEQQAEEREARKREREQQKRKALAAARRPLTISDLAGKELPTPREAADLVAAHGGAITAHGDELIVELADGVPERVLDGARVLFQVAPTVLTALAEKTDKPLAARLPDAPVRASGRVG